MKYYIDLSDSGLILKKTYNNKQILGIDVEKSNLLDYKSIRKLNMELILSNGKSFYENNNLDKSSLEFRIHHLIITLSKLKDNDIIYYKENDIIQQYIVISNKAIVNTEVVGVEVILGIKLPAVFLIRYNNISNSNVLHFKEEFDDTIISAEMFRLFSFEDNYDHKFKKAELNKENSLEKKDHTDISKRNTPS